MGDLAASGGYYISMDADYIVAQSGTITGSIGVIAMLTSLHRTLKKNLKVSFDSYQTMDNADTFSTMKLPEDKRLELLRESIDFIYDDFLQKVAAGRAMDIEKVREVAKGRVWSGLAAKSNGLVDELGDTHLALERLQERMSISKRRLDQGSGLSQRRRSTCDVARGTECPRNFPEVQSLIETWKIVSQPGEGHPACASDSKHSLILTERCLNKGLQSTQAPPSISSSEV